MGLNGSQANKTQKSQSTSDSDPSRVKAEVMI